MFWYLLGRFTQFANFVVPLLKMRISSIGILLLTAMVTSKYVISLYSLDISDGSFSKGIKLDISKSYIALNEIKAGHESAKLLAANTINDFNPGPVSSTPYTATGGHRAGVDYQPAHTSGSFAAESYPEETEYSEDPISMESGHTLVVYDIVNPSNSLIATTQDDIVDDIPLDNGNTIVSGLMMVMPRR